MSDKQEIAFKISHVNPKKEQEMVQAMTELVEKLGEMFGEEVEIRKVEKHEAQSE